MKQYLSPKELAQAIGVSESSLKRWADDGRIRGYRTAGGHRRIDITEAVRFIRDSAMPVRDPQALGLADVSGPIGVGGEDDASPALLRGALEAGAAGKVRAMLVSMYLGGRSIAELFDGLVADAMHALGELWRDRDDGIMIEHRATDICLGAISQLRALLPQAHREAPVALGGALGGDPYLLPSLMAATVLASEGFREMNLGPDTPAPVIVDAAQRAGARLVWVSVSVAPSMDAVTSALRTVVDGLADRESSIVIGGRSLPQPLGLKRPNLHIASSMSELAAFARGLNAAHGSPAPREA